MLRELLTSQIRRYSEFSQYSSLSGVISSVLVGAKHFIFYFCKMSEILPDLGQIGVSLLFLQISVRSHPKNVIVRKV